MKFEFRNFFEGPEKRATKKFEGSEFEKKPKTQDEEAEAVMTDEQKMQSESRAEGYGLGKEDAQDMVRGEYEERIDFHKTLEAQDGLRQSIAEKNGYKEVGAFVDNRAWAYGKKEGTYLIDTHGKEIAGPYAGVELFDDGSAFVKKQDKKFYLIDTDGHEIAGPFWSVMEAGIPNNSHIKHVIPNKDEYGYFIDRRDGTRTPEALHEAFKEITKKETAASEVMTDEQKMQSESRAEGYGLGEKEGRDLGKKEGEELWKEYRTRDKK